MQTPDDPLLQLLHSLDIQDAAGRTQQLQNLQVRSMQTFAVCCQAVSTLKPIPELDHRVITALYAVLFLNRADCYCFLSA